MAELRNGSLLLTSRLYGKPWLTPSHPATDLRRGFARSDDGGATWAQIWYLEQRQPEVLVGTCDHALVSDVDAPSKQGLGTHGVLYYGHPSSAVNDSLPRANYTLHSSRDGGASWEFVDRIYAGGAGYSDMNVLPAHGGKQVVGVAFQKTFDPPVPTIEGGGYNLGFATIPID